MAWNLIGNLVLPGFFYVPANLAVAGVLLALARQAGLSWDHLGFGPGTAWRGLVVGLAAAALVGLALAVAVQLPAADDLLRDEGVLADSSFDRWFVPSIRIPLGTAVFEEVLFRSVLLGALLVRTTTGRAVVVSSVAFGLWHVVPAWEGTSGGAAEVVGAIIGTVLVTTAFGAVLSAMRLWTRSTVAPILTHTATNSLAYVAALVELDLI